MSETSYDGLTAAQLARTLAVPRVVVERSVASTMDIAHSEAAAGAPAGTVVLADVQTAGRGRGGKSWTSMEGRGIWLTLVERPGDPDAIDVLSLRIGLAAARALDRFAAEPIRIKWPNDLHVSDGKLGGILVEARWREQRPEWTAVGIGVNVDRPDDVPGSASLEPGTSRLEVLEELVRALRRAGTATGCLTGAELSEFATRDMARGRRCTEPARGTVRGINERGELVVALADSVASFRSGSLILETDG